MAIVPPEIPRLNNNGNNSTYFVRAEKQITSESKPRSLFIMLHLWAGTLVLWGNKNKTQQKPKLDVLLACVWLVVVGGLCNNSGCKGPPPRLNQTVKEEVGSAVLGKAVVWGEDSDPFPRSIVMIQQRKKVPERQILPETGKHSVLCRSFEAGIWRMQWRFKTPEVRVHTGTNQL